MDEPQDNRGLKTEEYLIRNREGLPSDFAEIRQDIALGILVADHPEKNISLILDREPHDSIVGPFIKDEFPIMPTHMLLAYSNSLRKLSSKITSLKQKDFISGYGIYSAEFEFPELQTLTEEELFAFLTVGLINDPNSDLTDQYIEKIGMGFVFYDGKRYQSIAGILDEAKINELISTGGIRGFYCLRLLRAYLSMSFENDNTTPDLEEILHRFLKHKKIFKNSSHNLV